MIERLVRNEAPSLLDTDKGNEIIDSINALKLSTGEKGIEVSVNQNGSLSISMRRGTADTPKYSPFEVKEISDGDVFINLGTLNGIAPTNTKVSVGTGTEFLYLNVTCSATGVESLTLESDTSAPDGLEFTEDNIPSDFKYLIAIVGSNKLQHQIVNTNLFAEPVIAYEEPKESLQIGEYPNKVYWVWKVT